MAEEYLTIAETAARLKIAPKSVRNKIASGVFQEGVHYFRPPGLSTRFKWSAVVEWMEQGTAATATTDDIPMPRRHRPESRAKKFQIAS